MLHRAWLRSEIPNHAAHARQQQNEAEDAPHYGSAGRLVSDQWLVRPVLRVGDFGSRAIGGCRPRRPPEKRTHLVKLCGIGQRAARDRVVAAAIAEYVGIVVLQLIKSLGANRIERNHACRRIVCIGPHDQLETRLKPGLLFRPEGLIIRGSRSDGPAIKDEHALAMYPVRAPIGSDIGAVSPNGAYFLATDGLPSILSILHSRAGEQNTAAGGHNLGRDGWRVVQNPDSHAA